ncbi:hypothetical protein NUW58_g77 [Xylaria curta]|uniref:Uncharacterized protein n=2 Tax=Xylaria curta TaxID=42375 RepID=A0ACC1PT48_9PEZI|nr:hypothetical protein NUW58_g1753 [Xylaria curta]KAJ2999197.1 hypothetical protein NUW58_g77 [Xylaria curta]
MAKIILTGATGYVGGQVLNELVQSGTKHSISVLSRDTAKSKKISEVYPHIRVVQGSLDDLDVVEQEASKADIVLNLASNKHLESMKVIHKALAKREVSQPAYWIQISGASVLAAQEVASGQTPGSPSSTVFDDLNDAPTLYRLIRAHPFRAVDNYMLDVAENSPSIKSALLFPPTIFGKGQGPVNQRSIQIPTLAKTTLQKGHGIRVGDGQSRWGNVHIRDLGRLITSLTNAATESPEREDLWGKNGLYLTGVGEMPFGEISQRVQDAAITHGHVAPNAEIEVLTGSVIDSTLPAGSVFYGSNARGQANRAMELLKWQPKEGSLEEEIERAVIEEAANLRN